MAYRITTEKELRTEFWEEFPHLARGKVSYAWIVNGVQNQQPADTRMVFVDWIDSLQKNGEISETLADRATL